MLLKREIRQCGSRWYELSFDSSSYFSPTCENDANSALFCLIRKGKRNDTNLSMYIIYFSFSPVFHPAAGGNQDVDSQMLLLNNLISQLPEAILDLLYKVVRTKELLP